MKRQIQGSLCLGLATLIWGSAFIAQSIGMDYIGPFTFQAFRCMLAVIGLLIVIAVADRFKKDGNTFTGRWADKKLWRSGLICGVPLFLACSLQQIALVDMDAGKAAFLTSMYIVIVPIIGIFRKERPSKMLPISVVLAVAGLYCLSCMGVTGFGFGDLIMLGSALMFAAQITCVDMFVHEVDPLRLNLIQAMVCSVLSFVAAFAFEDISIAAVWAGRLPVAYAGFLSMGAAYSLQIVGQKFLKPSVAALIMSLESVVALICGWLILHEQLTKWEAIGCVLALMAVVLCQLPDKKNEVS